MKILIYALGGGWGHITRAAGLALALGPRAQVRILANSPYLLIVKAAMPELAIEPVADRQEVAEYIGRERPEVLVVDTFPRGLGGELADLLPGLPATRILIHRDIKPEYAAWGGLHSFVADSYDCVFCPGERGVLADLPQARMTGGWVVREPAELSAGAEVVVCAGGNREEMPWYGEVTAMLARETEVKCLAAERPPGCPEDCWIRYWPSIDWIAQAKVVIGGAGYNTVNECGACSVPLIARAWPRKYDRQRVRAERSSGVVLVETGQEAFVAAIRATKKIQTGKVLYNGAEEAARWILASSTACSAK